MNGLSVEHRPEYPGRWVVMGDWFGVRMPVFESDADNDEFTQLGDCLSFVRDIEEET